MVLYYLKKLLDLTQIDKPYMQYIVMNLLNGISLRGHSGMIWWIMVLGTPIKAPVSNPGVVAISSSSTLAACSYASDDNMTYFGTVYIDTKDSYVEVCKCIENPCVEKDNRLENKIYFD